MYSTLQKLTILGYSQKWLDYGVLNTEQLDNQIKEFELGEDTNTEHYRYAIFFHWLYHKESFTCVEIENFIELAKMDSNEIMAGAAVKDLFLSPNISEEQFKYIESRLPEFGTWTIKLISRENLKKELDKGNITHELYKKCWEHKMNFKDNTVIEILIKKTDNLEILKELGNYSDSKKIRHLALNQIHSLTNSK